MLFIARVIYTRPVPVIELLAGDLLPIVTPSTLLLFILFSLSPFFHYSFTPLFLLLPLFSSSFAPSSPFSSLFLPPSSLAFNTSQLLFTPTHFLSPPSHHPLPHPPLIPPTLYHPLPPSPTHPLFQDGFEESFKSHFASLS